MRVLRGTDGVNRDLYIPARAVLETHRAREATGQLAMALALGRAGADGPPTHQVCNVLR